MKITAAAWFVLLSSPAALGCGAEPFTPPCAEGVTCDPELAVAPSEEECLEGLAALRVQAGCGVFASRSFGDDSNPGTMEKPVKTLARAVALAPRARGRVFACTDSYAEGLTLRSGIDLWGGFVCWAGWPHYTEGSASGVVTLLSPDAGGPPITVEAAQDDGEWATDGVSTIVDMHVQQRWRLQDFHSIAMRLRPGAVVEVLRSVIEADGAQKGEDGQDAVYVDPQPAYGEIGAIGRDACSAATVAGAPAVTTVCGDMVSTGGKGGDGTPDRGGDAEHGKPLPASNSRDAGLGGAGAKDGAPCQDGRRGGEGAPGAPGAAGQGGRLTEAGWEGVPGIQGGTGAPGQGGGGGGGAPGGRSACGNAALGGASGGSGGGGGCGGTGGRGGGAGGASIAIFAHAGSKLTLRETRVITGPGGAGGRGGEGQMGGQGVQGGPPGQAPDLGGERACRGGYGGWGGTGGYGGGGSGGPSIGIAYADDEQFALHRVTFEIGPGGPGGVADVFDETRDKANRGSDGFAAEMMRFAP
ncbi:hypothetical protein WME76_44380 (plasmid) [Sorangium sp. So ce119]|uniref:hypothetical protein n=1 Tax=Sorangium sp. So ce119 TaxID=3133279 RepID=UPI003F642360